nr:synaptobrevin, longin-like domain protein [Tanacetum cinerariifolium]
MSSLFADTHNVVAILEKSDAAEGFEQIIDFLNGSYIHYAFTVSPHIYISCIKQFWNSVSVKRSGDVTSQWKFLIHTILQSLSAKRISWNEFSTAMASAVICLSKGQRFNFSEYIFDSLVRNVDSSSKFYMVRKGFSGVETPLFESMLVVRDVAEEAEAYVPAQGDDVQEPVAEEVVTAVVPPTLTPPSPPSPVIPSLPPHQPPCPPQPQDAKVPSILFQQVLDTCSALARKVEGLENNKAAQQLEIVKLKARVKKLEKINMVKSSKL